jgi:hypothetical protein
VHRCRDALRVVGGEQVKQQSSDQRERAGGSGFGKRARGFRLGPDQQIQPVSRRFGSIILPRAGIAAY